MIKNKSVILTTRIASFIIVLLGIVSICGGLEGKWDWSLFMYYTIQSNTLVLIMFCFLIVKTIESIKDGSESIKKTKDFEMVCMIDIFLTFFVYWTMLAPTMTNLWVFSNVAVHGIAPLVCIVDYYLYYQNDRVSYRTVYYSLIFPLLYIIINSIIGLSGYTYYIDRTGKSVHFPYFFMDYYRLGTKTIPYIIGLVVFMICISHFVYGIDKYIIKHSTAKNK
jgi:hypothetical protein